MYVLTEQLYPCEAKADIRFALKGQKGVVIPVKCQRSAAETNNKGNHRKTQIEDPYVLENVKLLKKKRKGE
jgi:hypothetical protein